MQCKKWAEIKNERYTAFCPNSTYVLEYAFKGIDDMRSRLGPALGGDRAVILQLVRGFDAVLVQEVLGGADEGQRRLCRPYKLDTAVPVWLLG